MAAATAGSAQAGCSPQFPLPRPAPAALSPLAPVPGTAHEPRYPAVLCGSLGPRPGKAGARHGNELPRITLPHAGTCHGLTEGDGCAFPWLPQGTVPQPTEEQAQGSTGLQGLFYSLLWSIQKQLTEIIKSSIPDPHSSNCPSLSSWSVKPPSDLKPLLKNALDKGGGDGNTPLTKEKGNGLKCATKISTRTRFLMLESLLYGDWQDRDMKSAPSS